MENHPGLTPEVQKAIREKINEFREERGAVRLSLDDLDMVSGGDILTGYHTKYVNFMGLLMAIPQEEPPMYFMRTTDEPTYGPYERITEQQHYSLYMFMRSMVPEQESAYPSPFTNGMGAPFLTTPFYP